MRGALAHGRGGAGASAARSSWCMRGAAGMWMGASACLGERTSRSFPSAGFWGPRFLGAAAGAAGAGAAATGCSGMTYSPLPRFADAAAAGAAAAGATGAAATAGAAAWNSQRPSTEAAAAC